MKLMLATVLLLGGILCVAQGPKIAGGGGNGCPTVLRVRVVNAHNGKPVLLTVVKLNSLPVLALRAVSATDEHGVATFYIPEPLPPSVSIKVGGCWTMCSDGSGKTGDILQLGKVDNNRCDKKGRLRGKFTAQPGELTVFARPITIRDWFAGFR